MPSLVRSLTAVLAFAALALGHDGDHDTSTHHDPTGTGTHASDVTHGTFTTTLTNSNTGIVTGTNTVVTPTSQVGCPTVTETRSLCGTCPVPACLGLATVTQTVGCCPDAIPTVFLDFPCSSNCKGVGCSTSYSIATVTAATCAPTTTGGGGGGGSGTGTSSTGGTHTGTTSSTRTTSSSTTSTSQAAAGRPMPFRLWL